MSQRQLNKKILPYLQTSVYVLRLHNMSCDLKTSSYGFYCLARWLNQNDERGCPCCWLGAFNTSWETGVDVKKRRYNSIYDKLNEKRRIAYVSVIIFPDMIYNTGKGWKKKNWPSLIPSKINSRARKLYYHWWNYLAVIQFVACRVVSADRINKDAREQFTSSTVLSKNEEKFL